MLLHKDREQFIAIDRFSEDIDITFPDTLTQGERNL